MHQSDRSLWARLTRPMSGGQWHIVSIAGALLFGLTGFIDMWDGVPFPKVKLAFLLVAVIACGYALYDRIARHRK